MTAGNFLREQNILHSFHPMGRFYVMMWLIPERTASMNYCDFCSAPLKEGSSRCPVCGGTAYKKAYSPRVSVTLSPGEARRGCRRLLDYPGAPAPVRVSLPERLSDGTELYIPGVRFIRDDGSVEHGELRILVRVRGHRLAPALAGIAAAMLLGIAGFCLWWLSFYGEDVPPASVPVGESVQVQAAAPLGSAVPEATPSPEPQYTAMQRQAAALIPHFELRYYLMSLSDELLDNFCSLYSAVSNFESSCRFPNPMSAEELSNLMLLISYECPELLQFSAATEVSYYSDISGRVVSVSLPYCMSREERDRQFALCDAAAKALAVNMLTRPELERELAAYDLLRMSCYYDYDAPNACSAYGALVEGRAKCDGISLAMKWLCEEMGISCMVIAGNTGAGTVGHAWNIIRIDGTYYDLDVTNDVMSDGRSEPYYGAFNVSRHWLRDKYPHNVSFAGFIILPGSESMIMSFHALRGSYVSAGGSAEAVLFRQLDSLLPGETAFLQFESREDYEVFVASINEVMSRWGGISHGSFNFSLSHLDEFQVCRVSVSYI